MNMTRDASQADATAASNDLVCKSIFVKAAPKRAYRVFTEQMTRWWPLATHKLSKGEAVAIVVEPFVGGRMTERAADGSECTWGHVVTWEPPSKFVFTWEIGADFQVDSTLRTEVEVTFTDEDGGTRVVLEHRLLRAYGERAEEMKRIFDSPGGWAGIIELFGAEAAKAGD
jgi:uncharacterized protein YndB with AHSA1/START domain